MNGFHSGPRKISILTLEEDRMFISRVLSGFGRWQSKGLVICLLPLVWLWCYQLICRQSDKLNSSGSFQKAAAYGTDVQEVRISLTGDLMCHLSQIKNAMKEDSSYDFNASFSYVKDILSRSDFSIGNLETTLAGKRLPYAGFPAFNSPDAYLIALKNAGFDFLVTANNHSMDTGEEGLLRTIEQLKKNNIGFCGTYESQNDRDSIRILEIRGIRLAILNYTYGTNGLYPEPGHEYMLNRIDSVLIRKDAAEARNKGADLILVYYHYGSEYKAEPNDEQKKAIDYARRAGAMLIIGAHPHVVGPGVFFQENGRKAERGFIAWSLGNFISNQADRFSDAGIITTIVLEKNLKSRKVHVKEVEYTPTWVYRGTHQEKKVHTIFPAALWKTPEKIPAWLDSSSVKKMKEAYADTREVFCRYQKDFKLMDY